MRSVHLVAGNGGLAWFTQLFPHPDVAMNGGRQRRRSTRSAKAKTAAGTDKPLVYAPDSPFQNARTNEADHAFMVGQRTRRTRRRRNRPRPLATGTGMIAASPRFSRRDPTLLPVIGHQPVRVRHGAGRADVGDGRQRGGPRRPLQQRGVADALADADQRRASTSRTTRRSSSLNAAAQRADAERLRQHRQGRREPPRQEPRGAAHADRG